MAGLPPQPTKTADFNAVIVTWGPFTLNGGLESIKMARAEDAFTAHVATDGTVTRVVNNNRMGGVTLVYSQNATALDVLSGQAQLDEASGTAIYPIEVQDGRGRTLGKAPGAWIKKISDVSYEKEETPREWTFDCDQLSLFVGGLN